MLYERQTSFQYFRIFFFDNETTLLSQLGRGLSACGIKEKGEGGLSSYVIA
jgi:hypothetical protein